MDLRKVADAFKNGYTLIFLLNKDGEVLLLNRRNPPSKGKLSGVGGHIEYNESTHQCAIRETQEETGLIINNLEHLRYEDKIKSYVFYAVVDSFYPLSLPVKTTEGTLDKYRVEDIKYLNADRIIKELLTEVLNKIRKK